VVAAGFMAAAVSTAAAAAFMAVVVADTAKNCFYRLKFSCNGICAK
jgi:hypothetical protein